MFDVQHIMPNVTQFDVYMLHEQNSPNGEQSQDVSDTNNGNRRNAKVRTGADEYNAVLVYLVYIRFMIYHITHICLFVCRMLTTKPGKNDSTKKNSVYMFCVSIALKHVSNVL